MIHLGKSMWIARREEGLFWVMSYALANGHTQEYTNSVCIHLLSSNDQFGIPSASTPTTVYVFTDQMPLESLSVHPNSFPDTFRQAPNLSHSRRRVWLIILFCPLTPLATQCSGNRWAHMGEGCGQMGKRENGKW